MAFEDDFDGPAGSAADPARWSNQVGSGWNYGRDAQYYTPGAQNAALTGRGTLLISARTQTHTGPDGTNEYTSARLISASSVHYGHVEARLRLTMMQGAFPAFWLLGTSYASVGWPKCGEIDVMETVNQARKISAGLHGPAARGLTDRPYYWLGDNYFPPSTTWSAGWHVYSADWTESAVTWFIDGRPFAHVSKNDLVSGQQWTVDTPANLILNIAVGGWAGRPAPGFAASMEVDWVRAST